MTDRIVVATVTRGRPEMLGRLLESLRSISLPSDSDVRFVIVENAEALTLSMPTGLPGPMDLRLETEPGIPFARNAALKAAQEAGADWLVFVDDDETVRTDWLVELHGAAVRNGLDLAAGPVVPVAPSGQLARGEQEMMAFYERMAVERQARMAAQARPRDLPTNNWICRLSVLSDGGLRFDETLRRTGGSDTRLSRQAVAAGLLTGWIATAVVEEEMPRERLTQRYLYTRSKSQTLAKVQFEYVARGRPVWPRAIFHAVGKGLSGCLRILLSPILGSHSRLRGVRALGVGAGWVAAARGGQSRLYARTIGS